VEATQDHLVIFIYFLSLYLWATAAPLRTYFLNLLKINFPSWVIHNLNLVYDPVADYILALLGLGNLKQTFLFFVESPKVAKASTVAFLNMDKVSKVTCC